jgi:hypothetical protein
MVAEDEENVDIEQENSESGDILSSKHKKIYKDRKRIMNEPSSSPIRSKKTKECRSKSRIGKDGYAKVFYC